MARPALQIAENDALGLAPTGAARAALAGPGLQRNIEPSVMPSMPAPPTRSSSRRVMPS